MCMRGCRAITPHCTNLPSSACAWWLLVRCTFKHKGTAECVSKSDVTFLMPQAIAMEESASETANAACIYLNSRPDGTQEFDCVRI